MEQILDDLKTFKKVILVCASCKKIRDDKGVWKHQETPASLPREVVLSHGLCLDCVRELYPEVADKVLARNGCKSSAEVGG